MNYRGIADAKDRGDRVNRILSEHERTVNHFDCKFHCRCGWNWEAPEGAIEAGRKFRGFDPDKVPPLFGTEALQAHRTHIAERVTDELNAAPMSSYSAAIDEVYRLRRALAHEADVTNTYLGYKGFPKSRRKVAADSIEQMKASARGESTVAYAGTSYLSLKHAMREAEAPALLTVAQFESEKLR